MNQSVKIEQIQKIKEEVLKLELQHHELQTRRKRSNDLANGT